jgi:formate C-acetyltransferase
MANEFQWQPISERIVRIREKRDAFTQGKLITINTERTKLYTDYYREHPSEHPLLKRAGAALYWAENHEANIFDDDIIVGTPGPDERSLGVYVDNSPDWILDIIDESTFKQAWQAEGSIRMSDEQRDILADAYDIWKDISMSKMFEGAVTDDFYSAIGTGPCMNYFSDRDGSIKIGAMIQGHYVANFNKAVNVGFGAVRAEALAKIEEHQGKIFGDWAKKHVFYYAMVRVCDAAILLAKRYAASCRVKAAMTPNAERREELLSMAESLEWIMENPARTYWEGLQTIILYELLLVADCQQHGQSMGRIDKYVGHLLRQELDAGTLTPEQAQEYTDAFLMRICDIMVVHGMMLNNKRVIELNENGMNAYMAIYAGMTATGGIVLTIGGSTAKGEDDCNAVTRLLLQSYGRMRVPDPTIALRIHPKTPEDVWRLGIECSKLCGGMPQLLNDTVVIPSMMQWGFTRQDAADYSIVGCVEPGGTGNEWSASGNDGANSVWNMTEVISLLVNGGRSPRTGKMSVPVPMLYEYKSFEEVKDVYVKLVEYCIDWTVSFSSMYELAYSQNFPCVTASVMMDGCMESGMDVTEGGAKYNRTGLTACGTANVADSLMAIKKLCFDDKTVTTRELYDALQADWEGYEQLRQTVINGIPHYGNDDEDVDALASWALGQFADIVAQKRGPRGNYCGGTFTMTAHIMFGKMLGATPDGRKSGDPIADAISPRQGFDKNGPTAYLRSAAKLPHVRLANGDQLNIRFTPSSVMGEDGAAKLRSIISTYFRLGGMQVQFNVVGTDKLLEAQKDPLNHKDLIVRIAGFSTYFVTLTPEVQNDFITRTEQSL